MMLLACCQCLILVLSMQKEEEEQAAMLETKREQERMHISFLDTTKMLMDDLHLRRDAVAAEAQQCQSAIRGKADIAKQEREKWVSAWAGSTCCGCPWLARRHPIQAEFCAACQAPELGSCGHSF